MNCKRGKGFSLENKPSNLTKYRRKKKLTINELAEKTGVSGATICRYERGERKMPVEMAKVIAQALNIKCWWKLY